MKNTGDGRRKTRVEKEVQNVISNYIIQQMKNDIPGVVTLTRIQMPSDFRAAQAFVTYYDAVENEDVQKVDVIKILNHWAKDIQDEIAHQLKMRYCPKITFYYDESTEHILKIENILSNLSPNQKVHAPDEFDEEEEES